MRKQILGLLKKAFVLEYLESPLSLMDDWDHQMYVLEIRFPFRRTEANKGKCWKPELATLASVVCRIVQRGSEGLHRPPAQINNFEPSPEPHSTQCLNYTVAFGGAIFFG